MKVFVALIFVFNVFIVNGLNTTISFYTEQEHEALQLCAHEYQTQLDTSYFVEHASLPDESDHNMKCLFYCVPQKIGVTDEKGIVNSIQVKDMIKTKYPSLSNTAVKILMKKCGKERAASVDKCDKWYEMSKCTWKLYLEYQTKIEAKREKKTTPPRRHSHQPKDKKQPTTESTQ
ncbi:general odorant-binding protein 56d [Planococcus citri]|uniref:general odorant-binding protein 56d n=1 Tax=Planococcus citri TaxID=170843 RepID=UPI0031F850FE